VIRHEVPKGRPGNELPPHSQLSSKNRILFGRGLELVTQTGQIRAGAGRVPDFHGIIAEYCSVCRAAPVNVVRAIGSTATSFTVSGNKIFRRQKCAQVSHL
jgi:hypothetical protein